MSSVIILSHDPQEAVEWLTDTDIIRMPITVGQILMTAWGRINPSKFPKIIEDADSDIWLEFASHSKQNYVFLWNFGMDLIDEHYHRFGSRQVNAYKHGMWRIFDLLQDIPPLPDVGDSVLPVQPEVARATYVSNALYSHRDKPTWR